MESYLKRHFLTSRLSAFKESVLFMFFSTRKRNSNYLLALTLMLFSISFSVCADPELQPSQGTIYLTADEQEFIRQNHEITLGAGASFEPFIVKNQDGTLTGHDIQIAKIIAERTGLNLRFELGIWNDIQKAASERKLDGLMSASMTEERGTIFNSSYPYIFFSSVAIVKKGNPLSIHGPEDIGGKKVAMQRGNKLFEGILERITSDVEIIYYDSIHELLSAVVSGAADLCILDETAPYLADKLGLKQLIEVPFSVGKPFEIVFLLRNDRPELVSIFNKGLASIHENERIQLKQQWFGSNENRVDYALLIKTVLVLVSVLAVTFFWAYTIRSSREKLRAVLAELRSKDRELEAKNEVLEALSITDHLTHLINRAKLDEVLDAEIQRFHRYDTPVSILMVDIDLFKQVNDQYGHQVGDQVLVEIAKGLEQHSRDVDVVGRWGGEEFLLICPNTELSGALALAENLRCCIDQKEFAVTGHQTASFGVSTAEKNESVHSLILKADEALYLAKEKGRNRTEVYSNR